MLDRTRIMAGAVALAFAAAGAATAHGEVKADLDDPISLRMHMMKQAGGAMKLMGDMAKGETEFAPRVALASLHALRAVSLGYYAQFPEGSDMGLETEASPKIWEDPEGFKAAVAEFIRDTGTALESPPQDLDGLKQTLGMIGENCKNCHEDYRVEKE